MEKPTEIKEISLKEKTHISPVFTAFTEPDPATGQTEPVPVIFCTDKDGNAYYLDLLKNEFEALIREYMVAKEKQGFIRKNNKGVRF